jgi:hypothetical protein
MKLNSLCADGWEDVFALLVGTLSAVVIWYTRGFYVNWIVFVAGIGAGVILLFIIEFAENHPVAGFPITMTFILVMLVAFMEKTLAAGGVAAVSTATVIKGYRVYL